MPLEQDRNSKATPGKPDDSLENDEKIWIVSVVEIPSFPQNPRRSSLYPSEFETICSKACFGRSCFNAQTFASLLQIQSFVRAPENLRNNFIYKILKINLNRPTEGVDLKLTSAPPFKRLALTLHDKLT
jgi:hypothetical protein